MKYTKLFQSHSDYNTYINSQDKVLPNVSYCENENEVHFNPWTYAETYLTFVALEDGTFTFTPVNDNIINYSTDNGSTWVESNSVNVITGNNVLWKGQMTPNIYGIGTFSSTGNFDVKGNLMSLLYGDNFKWQTDLTGKARVFHNLFYNNTKLINAKDLALPATTLVSYCYEYMFQDCTSLITAPELPAATLTNNCYNSMFSGCSSLTTAPNLPATTLANYCYNWMFKGCTSLAEAPELPATTLAESCYNSMFSGCSSLTTAPVLPAITLVTNWYASMFSGCSSLNYIKAMFTTTPSINYTLSWHSDVAVTGTFVKNSAATWTNVSPIGIPSGWTIETASE